jgi:hypothetical protein
MRPDLQGLEITRGELRRLCGVRVSHLLRPAKISTAIAEGLKTLFIVLLLVEGGLLLFWIFPDRLPWIIAVTVAIALLLIIHDIRKIRLSLTHKNLIHLIDDTERFNNVIAAIHINDQIEAAGNSNVAIQDRDTVIEALKFTREDLVRALKTERILRNNHQFIVRNPDLFANNLTALAALQTSDRASEHGKLLNEALQIAVSARTEIEKLHDRPLE